MFNGQVLQTLSQLIRQFCQRGALVREVSVTTRFGYLDTQQDARRGWVFDIRHIGMPVRFGVAESANSVLRSGQPIPD